MHASQFSVEQTSGWIQAVIVYAVLPSGRLDAAPSLANAHVCPSKCMLLLINASKTGVGNGGTPGIGGGGGGGGGGDGGDGGDGGGDGDRRSLHQQDQPVYCDSFMSAQVSDA